MLACYLVAVSRYHRFLPLSYVTVARSRNLPHYYTGAVVSAGYPIPLRVGYDWLDQIQVGGEPHNTYTTVTLHSPPSLLSGAKMVDGLQKEVFTAEHHTPISIYTRGTGYLVLHPSHSSSTIRPAFLLSFECEYCRRCGKMCALMKH
mgnify:FL=1